ncbi:MAG: Gfo/Idh/MocA family oxidoreductase [Bryobacterales bacterium]|nr:Gfo/Idh/MocA family oxidoreductase [Bryobacterales bacterium]
MARKKLRVALVGQGFMGRAHSNAYRQVGHFFDVPYEMETAVLCGRNAATLEKMAATWGWKETATDWRAAVERPDIDVVDVAVPNALHAEVAVAAAKAGKIVLCEKPLAVSALESARMRSAVEGLPNMVWFNYRRVPAVALAKRMIEENRVGRIFHYRAQYLQEWGNDPTRPPNWKTSRAGAGSGAVGDLMTHSLDLALWLNGPLREVMAMQHTFAQGRDIDDATLVMARFANGSVGSLEATRYAVGCRNRNAFEIHGDRGMLGFDLEDLTRLTWFDATEPRDLQAARKILVGAVNHPYAGNFWKLGHVTGYEHTFIAALGDFLGALSRGVRFEPGFAEGHRVQLAVEAIQRSAATGGWVTVEQDE